MVMPMPMPMPTSAGRLSSPPPTSAAVLEFICLFSHDLRRKQKRWQDGRLKYHSFNKRVMVYDERGNFVGDMHWRRDYDFGDGEEIELERGGVIVQVNDLVHRFEQDLSELLDKRAKEKEQRSAQAVARPPAPSVAALPRTVVRPMPLGHRPLHRVIGTPAGHLGRALVPKESPFEQRHQPSETPAESHDERAAKRRKYEPPPSKSGYAQALFGQSLTLSATPTSSAPARRRVAGEPVYDPEPSSSTETGEQSAREVPESISREIPKSALREQPRSSRHFNQPVARPPAVRKLKSSGPVNVEEDEEPQVRRKQDRSLGRTHMAEHQNRMSPADDNVMQIVDPGPAIAKSVRPARAAKSTPETTRARNSINEKARVTLSSPDLEDDTTRSAQTDAPGQSSKQAERLAILKRVKSTKPKPSAKKTTAESSASKKDQAPKAGSLSRRPSEPVTELRIKSSKKRGLMMMSEALKKPRKQSSSHSAVLLSAPLELQSNQAEENDDPLRSPSPQPEASKKVELRGECINSIRSDNAKDTGQDDDPFRSPSPPLQPASETEGLGRENKPTQRKHSTELGEEKDQDPFRPPSPAAQLRTGLAGRPSVFDRSGILEIAESFCQDQDLTHVFQDEPQVEPEDITEAPAIEVVQETITPCSAPLGRAHDPYRLPSSSPEELSTRLLWMPSSPKNRPFSSHADTNDGDIADVSSEINRADRSNKAAKPKQTRKARWNVVLDDDDEVDERTTLPNPDDVEADETIHFDSDPNLAPSKKPAKPKKATKATKRNSKAHDTQEEEDCPESTAGKIRSKKHAKPGKSTKRKAKAQEKCSSLESEDEQPTKRQRSTRKTNSRTTDANETPLPSEQDVSEDERSSKRSRKGKAPKPTGDRPRLTKIKQSHKSRELVGFDLAALHTPLRPRGIGVPFSTLSSPVKETIIRRIDRHATMEQSSDHMTGGCEGHPAVGISDPLKMFVEADEMDVDISPARARDQEVSIGPPLLPAEGSIAGENGEKTRAESVEGCSTTRRPASPASPGEPTTSTSGPLGQTSENKPGEKIDPGRDVHPVKDAPTRHQRTSDGRPNNTTTESPSAEVTHMSKDDLSPLSGVSTNELSPGNLVSASPERNPDYGSHAVFEPEAARAIQDAVPEPIMDHQSASMRHALCPIVTPSGKPTPVLSRQGSRTANVCLDGEAPRIPELPGGADGVNAPPAIVEALVQKRTPLSRQASEAPTVNEGFQVPKVVEKPSSEETPREVEVPNVVEVTETICEVSAAAVAGPAKASVHNSAPAVRWQPPIFKPVTIVKLDEATLRPKGSLTGDSEPTPDISAQEINAGLSRKPSDQGIEPNAEETTDTAENTWPDTTPPAPIQRQKSVGLRRTISVTRSINNLTAAHPPPPGPPEAATAESSTRPAAARLTNPASRGRKAALAFHAAGPVPQRMIPPTQPSAIFPISTADLACTPLEEAPPKEAERPKKKMTFPGFQSARAEGPWSREAFDLLGSERPG